MSRKSTAIAVPTGGQPVPLHLGFSVWVEPLGTSATDIRSFRRGLDTHLAACGLVRSLNPLHMLVWSPERSATVLDQVRLLAWMESHSQLRRVALGELCTHVGIPRERGRPAWLSVAMADAHVRPVLEAWRIGRIAAPQVVELLGRTPALSR